MRRGALTAAAAATVALGVAGCAAKAHAACGVYRDDATVRLGGASFKTEIAATRAERDRGLSGRSCIAADRAMLFDLRRPGYYSFWMKGMRFPLDILWIGPDHRVVTVVRDLGPATYPKLYANRGGLARWVLEFHANTAARLHVRAGTRVVIAR